MGRKWGGGGGGVSPTFDQIGEVESKGEKKKKKVEEKEKRWRKRKKGEERKRKLFLAFRRLKLDSLRIKVSPRDENYVWVPKSMDFIEL